MLNEVQRQILADLIKQVRSEPAVSPQKVIDLLGHLIDDPELGPGTITRAITAQTDRLLQQVAERAFLLGQQQQ